MKLNALVAALVVLTSTSALAEKFGFILPAAVSLEQVREVLVEDSDVRISTNRIDAPFGVRRADREEFLTAVPVEIGAMYLVKDAHGREHQLEIRHVIDGQMFVELKPLDAAAVLRRVAQPGRYKVKAFAVNGEALEVDYPELLLQADGTFSMGRTQGRYAQGDQALALNGYYAQWGAASVHDGGSRMTFEFFRNNGHVKAVLERVPEEGGAMVAASR